MYVSSAKLDVVLSYQIPPPHMYVGPLESKQQPH